MRGVTRWMDTRVSGGLAVSACRSEAIFLRRSSRFEIRFGDPKVSIPEELVKRPELFDPAITAAARIAVDHAEGGKETRKSLAAYLRKIVPQLYDHEDARR